MFLVARGHVIEIVGDLDSPGGLRVAPRIAETAILCCRLPAVAGSTQRLPATAVPKHRLVTAMGIDVIDDVRRAYQIMSLALHAQRMLVQECGAFGAPALRAIERAGFWIASPRIVLVTLTLVAPPNGTMDWWTYGHDADLDDGNDGAGNDNACDGSSPSQALLSQAYPEYTPSEPFLSVRKLSAEQSSIDHSQLRRTS